MVNRQLATLDFGGIYESKFLAAADAARVRALSAYKDFLTLWKVDVDPFTMITAAVIYRCV